MFVQSRDGNTVATNPSVARRRRSRQASDLRRAVARRRRRRAGRGRDGARRPNRLVGLASRAGRAARVAAAAATSGSDRRDGSRARSRRGRLFNVPAAARRRRHRRRVRGADDATPVAKRPWITPIVTMPTARDLPGAFRQLRRLGVARISCIGGRTIARQLIDAGLIQDLYLTTSAKTGGEPGTPLYPTPLDGELDRAKARHRRRTPASIFEHAAASITTSLGKSSRTELSAYALTRFELRQVGRPDLPGLGDQLDLEQLRPPLAGDEQAIAFGVVGDAVEHVGARRARRASAGRADRCSRSTLPLSRERCARCSRSARRWRRSRPSRTRARSGSRSGAPAAVTLMRRFSANVSGSRKRSSSVPSLMIRLVPSCVRPQPSPAYLNLRCGSKVVRS